MPSSPATSPRRLLLVKRRRRHGRGRTERRSEPWRGCPRSETLRFGYWLAGSDGGVVSLNALFWGDGLTLETGLTSECTGCDARTQLLSPSSQLNLTVPTDLS